MNGSYKSTLTKIYLFKFFMGFHLFAGVLIPFFTDWGKISFTQIMIIQSWYMFWIFIFEMPTGVIADFLGRKKSLILGCFTLLLAVIFYVIAPNFYLFLLGEFFWALSAALISGADSAILYDTLKKYGHEEDSKKIQGRVESIFLVAIAISSPLGSIIAAYSDVRMPTLLMLIPFGIATLISFTLEEPDYKEETEKRKFTNYIKTSFSILSNNSVLKILALDLIFINTVGYFMLWLQQPLLKQAGVNIIYWGFSQVACLFCEIIVLSNIGAFEKLFGSKRNFLLMGSIIGGVAYIIGSINHSVPITLLTIYLIGAFLITRKTIMINYMNKYIPSSERATVISTVSMINSFVIALANPFFGFFADRYINITMLVIGIATIIFALLSKIKEEHLIEKEI